MFITVLSIFLLYSIVFILFDDYDRSHWKLLEDIDDRNLVGFSVVVMLVLGYILHRYAMNMDARISQEQAEQQGRIRRELTQNIAHELKTPATSLQGYLETLSAHPDMDAPQRKLFIERSAEQAKRLTALIQDISTLQRMDEAPDMHTFEQVDLAQIITNVNKETGLQLTRRHMKLVLRLPAHIPIQGNATLLYGIFRNLTDNALNYAGEGTIITLTLSESINFWHFTFRDNGPGVAEHHLEHLFDRFYRIDKGRSRKLGGTGLGLSIVKNAVLLHGGRITASNDHGLRFDFTLRKS